MSAAFLEHYRIVRLRFLLRKNLGDEPLARHRPASVGWFFHETGGEKKESAVSVFLFHGRYRPYTYFLGADSRMKDHETSATWPLS